MAEEQTTEVGQSQHAPKVSELKGRRIGRILTKMAKITREQVHEALQLQEQRKLPLGQLYTKFRA